jgi:hypothetical protein
MEEELEKIYKEKINFAYLKYLAEMRSEDRI